MCMCDCVETRVLCQASSSFAFYFIFWGRVFSLNLEFGTSGRVANHWTPRVIAPLPETAAMCYHTQQWWISKLRPPLWKTSNALTEPSSHLPISHFTWSRRNLLWSGIKLHTDQWPSSICFFSILVEFSIFPAKQ